jgi:hypothetical protein
MLRTWFIGTESEGRDGFPKKSINNTINPVEAA